jgi:hypothetical protein
MSEPLKAHVRLVPRVKSPVASAPAKPPPSSFSEHDAITRRVVLSPDEPGDSRDSMEMTAVRPESLAASFDESLEVTRQRARARSAGDHADDGANPMDPDGDAGETIALPARQARAPGAAVRTGLVDARQRLVTTGANRARTQGHTPDPRRRRS